MDRHKLAKIRINIDTYYYCIFHADNKKEMEININEVMDILETKKIEDMYRVCMQQNLKIPSWYDLWLEMRVKVANAIMRGEKRLAETNEFIEDLMDKGFKRDEIIQETRTFSRKKYRYTNIDCIDKYVKQRINNVNKKKKIESLKESTD